MTERTGGAQVGARADWRGVQRAAERETVADFADIVCADDDLLYAAFDAIVAAEWPTPPSTPGQRGQASRPDRRRHRSPSRSGRPRPAVRSRHTGTNPRQRSPP